MTDKSKEITAICAYKPPLLKEEIQVYHVKIHYADGSESVLSNPMPIRARDPREHPYPFLSWKEALTTAQGWFERTMKGANDDT